MNLALSLPSSDYVRTIRSQTDVPMLESASPNIGCRQVLSRQAGVPQPLQMRTAVIVRFSAAFDLRLRRGRLGAGASRGACGRFIRPHVIPQSRLEVISAHQNQRLGLTAWCLLWSSPPSVASQKTSQEHWRQEFLAG
jgi:hypothetical protein